MLTKTSRYLYLAIYFEIARKTEVKGAKWRWLVTGEIYDQGVLEQETGAHALQDCCGLWSLIVISLNYSCFT